MSFALPVANPRIKRVASFDELVSTPFAGGINALCWPRTLSGDFAAVVEKLSARSPVGPGTGRAPEENDGILAIDPSSLIALLSSRSLSVAARAAIDILLEDLRLLRDQNRDPVLNLIRGYPRDDDGGPVPTDVFSFHADSAPVPADTWLCTYHGPASEGLRNEDARRHVDLSATRAALLARFGGADDAAFAEFLHENCYDLHYASRPHAQPYSFGLGNLWRIACEYPDSPVPPCLHRAPATLPTDPPRLLLIS